MANPFTSAQVPQSMQMIAPDLAVQQTQLMRQQQLADMLKQQALQQDGGTQMVGGWTVKKSPFEALAKIGQAYFGNQMQGDIDQKNLQLGQALQKQKTDAFSSMLGLGGSQPAQAQQPQTSFTGDQALTERNVTPTAQTPTPSSPVDTVKRQAMAAWLAGNQELGNKLAENALTMTTEQRDMLAKGQDPYEMGRLGIAEAKKRGMIEFQPGTTTKDLATGVERFQPKLPEGMTLQDGQVSVLPNYSNANASIEGAKAGAVASAQAGQEMTVVDTPSGKMMMTKAQARDLATGGQQGTQQYQGQDVLSQLPENVRNSILQSAKAGNGKFDVNFQLPNGRRIVGSVDLNKTGGSGKGIELQDEGAQAFAKKVNEGGAQNLLDSRDKARSAVDELNAINESRAAIKSGAYQGFGADTKTDAVKIASSLGIDIDSNKASQTDYLRSTLGKGILDNAKKLGVNPTDSDAKRLDAIMGTIGKDPKALDKILDWRDQMAHKVIDLHNRDIESASQGGAKFPFDLKVNAPKYEDQSIKSTANVPPKNNQGWILHTDAKGNRAYVSPDGKQFQEVK
jgi:hypothetical protein